MVKIVYILNLDNVLVTDDLQHGERYQSFPPSWNLCGRHIMGGVHRGRIEVVKLRLQVPKVDKARCVQMVGHCLVRLHTVGEGVPSAPHDVVIVKQFG